MFLMELEMVSGYSKYLREACQDYTYHQSLFLESWRTWRVLMELEMCRGV